jgi:hypothetical protein
MKKWRNRFSLIAISLLFGGMMGVQLMSEHAGLNEPKPLTIPEPRIEEPKDEAIDMESNQQTDSSGLGEEEGMSNFFSDLGFTVATGMENATRSGLEAFMGAIRNGVSK